MKRYSAIALILLAATSVHAAEKKLDRSFTVSPGGTLIVDADSASVVVSGGDSSQVTVHMVVRGPEDKLADMRFDAQQTSDGVTVTSRRPRQGSWFNWGSWNTDERIEVTVPHRYAIEVRTNGGSVELRDTTGWATLRTSGGSITAKNVNGNLQLRTSGGGIVADTIRGDVEAGTSGGDVKLLNIDGRIKGHTSGGSVRCSLVGSNRGISARTSGGSIELILPRGTTGTLNATTSGGSVESDFPIPVTVANDHRLGGALNGGGQPIEAHTSGGSIRVRAAN